MSTVGNTLGQHRDEATDCCTLGIAGSIRAATSAAISAPELHVHKTAYRTPAPQVYAHKMHAHEMPAYKMNAHGIDAYEIHLL